MCVCKAIIILRYLVTYFKINKMAGKQGIILDADLTNTVYIYEEIKYSQPFIVILLLVS